MEEEIKNSGSSASGETIKDAEVQSVVAEEVQDPEESQENIEKKKKRDFYIELVLFLILGILLGIAVKTEAVKRVTIGFDDYRMKIQSQDYDINKLQKDIAAKNNAAAAAENSQGQENGGSEVVPQDESGSNQEGIIPPSGDNPGSADQNNPSNNNQ